MLRNYLKVALRTFWKSKGFSFINVAGLAIGISTCLLITLYVQDELSYDTFHEKADRIYRLTELLHLPTEVRARAVTAPPMAPSLKENFPEVLKTVRLSESSRVLSNRDKKFYDTRIWYADSTLFDIFSFPMIKGNPDKALVQPYSIVLTEKAAKKYFGDEDPMGKTLLLSDTIPLTVTGLVKNIRTHSHIQFDVMLSRSTVSHMRNFAPEDNWFNNGLYTYLLLPEGYDYKQLEAKFPAFLEKQMADEKKDSGLWYDFVLQPLTSIHLKSTLPMDMGPNGNIKYVYTFSLVAALILLIACANYINLATAKSFNRAKELGMRKVVGAKRKQLMGQLLAESFLLSLFAFVIALAIVSASLPAFNTLTDKTISASFFLKPEMLFTILGLWVAIALLAGAYPAMLMSSFSPIKTLKNSVQQGRASFLRKGLVVFQFTMSIILIAGTILIFRQMNFMQSQNLGLNKDQIVQLSMRYSIRTKYQLIRDELSKITDVTAASVTSFSYHDDIPTVATLPEGSQTNEITSESVISVDYDFFSTFGIPVVAGRNFSKEFPADPAEGFIVNEAAVKLFKWGTPEAAIGKKLDWGLGKKGTVVGVVKNFNFSSLHESIRPLIIHMDTDSYSFVSLKLNSSDIKKTIQALEAKWSQLNLDSPFEHTFMDKDFAQLYKAEEQTKTIIGLFSGLAIFIACLGLFGLAAFTAEQRVKEIGVRKVLGATVFSILGLLSKDFLRLILVAIALAVPVAWYAASQWLDSFAYKTEISWWIFGVAGGTAVLIALFTVSFQSIKAALTNPVDSLRTE